MTYGVAVLLLVAATDRELCGHEGLVCGVGPVEAAAATARALALREVRALVHVGIAGARGYDVRDARRRQRGGLLRRLGPLARHRPRRRRPAARRSRSRGPAGCGDRADPHLGGGGRCGRRGAGWSARRGDGGVRCAARRRARPRARDRGAGDLQRDRRGRPLALGGRGRRSRRSSTRSRCSRRPPHPRRRRRYGSRIATATSSVSSAVPL